MHSYCMSFPALKKWAGFHSAWWDCASERGRKEPSPPPNERSDESQFAGPAAMTACLWENLPTGKGREKRLPGWRDSFPSSLILIGRVYVWGKGVLPIGNNKCFVAGARSFQHKDDIYLFKVWPVGFYKNVLRRFCLWAELLFQWEKNRVWKAFG